MLVAHLLRKTIVIGNNRQFLNSTHTVGELEDNHDKSFLTIINGAPIITPKKTSIYIPIPNMSSKNPFDPIRDDTSSEGTPDGTPGDRGLVQQVVPAEVSTASDATALSGDLHKLFQLLSTQLDQHIVSLNGRIDDLHQSLTDLSTSVDEKIEEVNSKLEDNPETSTLLTSAISPVKNVQRGADEDTTTLSPTLICIALIGGREAELPQY
eukprot:scaffold2341_cov212-Skeletonema_menzelii.AAC.3